MALDVAVCSGAIEKNDTFPLKADAEVDACLLVWRISNPDLIIIFSTVYYGCYKDKATYYKPSRKTTNCHHLDISTYHIIKKYNNSWFGSLFGLGHLKFW
jgi:hypothetical protein